MQSSGNFDLLTLLGKARLSRPPLLSQGMAIPSWMATPLEQLLQQQPAGSIIKGSPHSPKFWTWGKLMAFWLTDAQGPGQDDFRSGHQNKLFSALMAIWEEYKGGANGVEHVLKMVSFLFRLFHVRLISSALLSLLPPTSSLSLSFIASARMCTTRISFTPLE